MAKKRGRIGDDLFSRTEDEQPEEKRKNTYYLDAPTDDRLDMAKARLRVLTGEKVFKSDILEIGLITVLDDLDEHGADSILAKALQKRKAA